MTEKEKIRQDLLFLDSKAFYLKYIVKSNNWYFSNYLCIPATEMIEKMDYFKEIVSSRLDINFHNLQIVGSAKTGFSLSPTKALQPFHERDDEKESSDIDIAIISDKLFGYYWGELRSAKNIHYNQYYYQHLTASIFRGYINDRHLLKIDKIREEWGRLVDPINVALQDNLRFEHPISYRIYRSWEDLEDYQLIGISKAKKSIGG